MFNKDTDPCSWLFPKDIRQYVIWWRLCSGCDADRKLSPPVRVPVCAEGAAQVVSLVMWQLNVPAEVAKEEERLCPTRQSRSASSCKENEVFFLPFDPDMNLTFEQSTWNAMMRK
jgi:hypothetical protein